MNFERRIKASFTVIGKEGSTREGEGFVQRLWQSANGNFGEVAHLAKRDGQGNLAGIWGAMTDFSRSFNPWEEGFASGLYLAGVECEDEAQPPVGWSRWVVPGFEYLCAECGEGDVFSEVIGYMEQNGIRLVGAVQDYTCPENGKSYMYFPIRRL